MRRHDQLAITFDRENPYYQGNSVGSCRCKSCARTLIQLMALTISMFCSLNTAIAQAGEHILYGDFKVDESGTNDPKPVKYDLILYHEQGRVLARQVVANNGRYRFMNLANGQYDIVVEVENNEVAKIRVTLNSLHKSEFRQNIELAWRSNSMAARNAGEQMFAIDQSYQRTAANKALFNRAAKSTQKQDYGQAVSLLRQIVNDDAKDFEAWTELGTALLGQKKDDDAEKAYATALEKQPKYILALVNLGRLRLQRKNFEGAVQSLSQAVSIQPRSATANYYLGEAYLQVKKGSLAVIHLNAALKLDPIGKADGHLRLAALYNAAGMKDKAALEYEEFLKKKPDHPNKNQLQKYISQHKKP